jgi:hypothetical protein
MTSDIDTSASTGWRCSVEGCDRPVAARELCAAHYRRWQRFGSAQPDRPIRFRAQRARVTPLDVPRIVTLYRAGASAPGIARLLGASRSAIYTALHSVDIPMRTSSQKSPITQQDPAPETNENTTTT